MGRKVEGVGVMKDKELKLEKIDASHTLRLQPPILPPCHDLLIESSGKKLH